MADNDKTQHPEPPRDDGPTAWQRHRRAQLEWMRAVQAAQHDYQRQIAESHVVYQTALHKVTDESWDRRLGNFDAADQAPDTLGQTAEITREFRHGVNEADRAAQEAYGRAWYGLQDALQAAYAKYVVGRRATYIVPRAQLGVSERPGMKDPGFRNSRLIQ